MPSRDSLDPRESPARRQRRRRTHQRVDSNGELLPRPRRERERDREREEGRDGGSPDRDRERERRRRRERRREESSHRVRSESNALSAGQLAHLDKLNRKLDGYQPVDAHRDEEARREEEEEDERAWRREQQKERKRRREEEAAAAAGGGGGGLVYEYDNGRAPRRDRGARSKSRVVSGQALERGGERGYYSEKDGYREDIRMRGGKGSSDEEFEEAERKRKKRKKIFIIVGVVAVLLAIIIPVAVVLSNKNSDSDDSEGDGGTPNSATGGSAPSNNNLKGISESDIPEDAQGTELDPFSWYDTVDFNVTYTNEKVGGLSVMGLNSSWDDSKRANDNVPPLDGTFEYGTMPIRGVNLGGWLSIEPFITPSLFEGYNSRDGVVDEYTLTQKLGPARAKSTLEEHYSKFVSEQTFADIQAAGFDHVRIQYSYWAIETYDGDPYVPLVSWRYLLRGTEWARKYGLRVNLDLHGAPGSQNGWNHSGRQGAIGWLNGTDGDLNGDRAIELHKKVSTFFTQPRYKNLVTMYGLMNEPRMVELDTDRVLTWTKKAVSAIQANNFTGIVIFGDGFMGLDNWQGKLQDQKNLLLDVHQYVIFNVDQITLNHHDKINFACGGWTKQALRSQNTATGFGPTLCGEWSQADTDCAPNLNNVGVGSRWEGTLNMASGPGGSSDGSVLTPTCPSGDSASCSCAGANADPADYSDEYKQFLKMFAEAQMHSFEQGWGWFYWTWQTERATQWSYQAGLEAGILPGKTWERAFNCSGEIPDFGGLSEDY